MVVIRELLGFAPLCCIVRVDLHTLDSWGYVQGFSSNRGQIQSARIAKKLNVKSTCAFLPDLPSNKTLGLEHEYSMNHQTESDKTAIWNIHANKGLGLTALELHESE